MNYNETKETLMNYIIARIPFIGINTIEKTRTLSLLKEISNETNTQMKVHSMSNGFTNLVSGEVYNNDKLIMGALDFIAKELQTSENQIYILSDVSDLDTENITSRYLADLTNLAEEKSSVIMVITSNPIWVQLQRQGMTVEFELPDEEEIFNLVVESIRPYQNQIQIEWDKNDVMEVANILLGLSSVEIKNVIATLIARGGLLKDDLVDLKFAKDGMFSDINGLEKINVEDDLAFGGLQNLKTWLDEKAKLLNPEKREEMKKRGIKPPRGILLMGVPGCGKSLSSKAIAKRWERPLYRLDFATIQGRFVGQSEQQLKEAFDTAEHVSPCILWIDEIEKGLAGEEDSTGVTQRLIGQFLFWLQECKKDVFVVATANNVDKLPPELLRKGRFDELFFIDLPTTTERREILNLYLNKYFGKTENTEIINQLIPLTDHYSGSDIEAVLRDLAYNCIAENIDVTQNMVIEAFKDSVSMYNTNKEKVEKIRNWAKDRTINASVEEDSVQQPTPVQQPEQQPQPIHPSIPNPNPQPIN